MSRLPERLRWRIVYLLDKLPRQCWAQSVMWALYGHDPEEGAYRPWASSDRCRAEFAAGHSCYCGKFRDRSLDGAM